MKHNKHILRVIAWAALAVPTLARNLMHTTHSNYTSSTEVQNANHIFNSIHSSMRLWGSAINHNGMSFYLASIPKGVTLYHGSPHPDRINGTKFLALEPEHAAVFARSAGGPGGPSHHKPGSAQEVLLQEHDRISEQKGGWLHTYATTRDLNLIYIDGMSAGKSRIGTLDSQDIILLEDTIYGGVTKEYERAHAICNMSQERWGGHIDGAIRTAAGFEIILCSFTHGMKPLRTTRASVGSGPGHGGATKPSGLLQAVTSRYFDIGGNRVRVNYDNFVTAFSHQLDLFQGGSLPRVRHLSYTELDPIRQEIHSLVMDHTSSEPLINWQATTDMIVQRYARPLRWLASGNVETIEVLHDELIAFLNVFIDYDDRNEALELHRCAAQFIPLSATNTSLAFKAVHNVTYRICSTIQQAILEDTYDGIKEHLQALISYLDWTTWRECLGCKDHEFCAVAIWPSGSKEDHEHPECQQLDAGWAGGSGYWGPVWR